jgi:hypothetical protein
MEAYGKVISYILNYHDRTAKNQITSVGWQICITGWHVGVSNKIFIWGQVCIRQVG